MASSSPLVPACLLLLSALPWTEGQGAGSDFGKLQADVTSWYYRYSPFTATSAGVHTYDDLIGSISDALQPAQWEDAKGFLARLRAINSDELASRDDKSSYDVLGDMLQTYVDGYQWRDFQGLNPISSMEGWQTWPTYFASVHPFNTIGDYENFIARLQRFPTMIDEHQTLMAKAIEKNRTYHNVSIQPVFKQIDVIINVTTENSVFYTLFKDRLENKTTISTEAKESLRTRARAAVGNITDAFRRLKDYMQNEYAPRTRTFYGMLGYSDGKDYYRACLRWYISANYTPEQVHQIGLDEVARIEGKMKQIMAKQNFHGTVAEYFKMLMNDSRFHFDTGEEVLEEYRKMIFDRIEPQLPKFFNNLPGLPIVVRATTTDGIGGSYIKGDKDGSRPGTFNANVMRPKETPTFGMMALTLHEANPGHHLQLSYGLVSDMPDFRVYLGTYAGSKIPFAIPAYTAFVEGWALYSEALGEEMDGIYRDDYELMGRYSSEIFRACRLVIDTGLHYYGWDKERAIQYMLNYTDRTRTSVEIEVDRYITIPGQACAYKMGEIKIMSLRRKAEAALGNRFDLKAFHSVVLETGSLPLGVLENTVDSWIADVIAGTPSTPTCGSASLQSDVILKTAVLSHILAVLLSFVLQ